nr:MAG TPA: hypothetical protein [Caudoviricetes sp.]
MDSLIECVLTTSSKVSCDDGASADDEMERCR